MLKDRNFGQKRNSLSGQILQDYLAFTTNYQQGLTNKNLQLHCTLNKIASHNITLDNDFHILRRKSIYEKQQILRDSVQRAEELLQAKISMNKLRQSQILQQSRSTCMTQNLKKQLSHSDVVTHELSFRLTQMQIQMKNQLAEKDQIIESLKKRIDIYQRQNKKLQEDNRNLKVIQVQASLEKRYSSHSKSKSKLGFNYIKDFNEEENRANQEVDLDKQRSQKMQREKIARLEKENSRLLQQNLQSMTKIAQLQRQVERGRKQVEQLRRVRQNPKQNRQFHKLKQGIKQQKEQQRQISSQDPPQQTEQQQAGSLQIEKKTLSLYDAARGQGIIASIITLRNGINKEIFDVFIDSLKRAEKAKTNAFAQFLDAWRMLDVGRVEPYVVAYFQAIGDVNLYLQEFGSTLSIQIKKKIDESVPIRLHQTEPPTLPEALQSKSPFVFKTHLNQLHKQHEIAKKRSQINQWILSTIQFTINQQKTNANNLKNSVLYLFRLLSIQYRISYPPKGQEIKYHLDTDVRYCLLHWVVDGVRHVIANL